MSKKVNRSENNKIPKPGIFSLLKPYSGMVTILIIMALAWAAAINMLIPKIIANGIDAFSGNNYNISIVIIQFLAASVSNIYVYFPAKYYSDVCLRKGCKRFAVQTL